MVYFIKDNKVFLRKISPEDDLENYLDFVNDAENLKWVDGVGNFPLNKDDIMEHIRGNKNFFLSIFNDKGTHVGNINLSHIDLRNRKAILGIIMGKKFEGKGYAAHACKLVIRHAFEVLNLHKIYLTVNVENKKAIALYEKLGFVKEGIERDMHLCGFKYYDGVRYYLTEEACRRMKRS